jgi:hypothetical protein
MISKIALVGVGAVALVGSQIYGDRSLKMASNAQYEELSGQIQSIREADQAGLAEVIQQLDLLQDRLGASDETNAKSAQQAARLRQEQLKAIDQIKQTLTVHESAVDSLRTESDAKLDARVSELRNESTSSIGQVQAAVGTVKGDLDTAKNDLNSGLTANKREISDVREQLTSQIARNAQEVAALRRLGERDYYEFDIRNTKDQARVAAIRLQLNKADVKGRKYDVTLLVDDNKVQKKGQFINEPVTFLVGKDRIRYELVVNMIDKNRIQGYVSTPKANSSSASASLQD